jgi:hypothetical protein
VAYTFDPKTSTEVVDLSVDFKNRLADGETLQSATTWTATVYSGTDPSPGDVISGSASVSGTKAVQRVHQGVDGVTYCLLAKVTTSNGQELEEKVHLMIQDSCE